MPHRIVKNLNEYIPHIVLYVAMYALETGDNSFTFVFVRSMALNNFIPNILIQCFLIFAKN